MCYISIQRKRKTLLRHSALEKTTYNWDNFYIERPLRVL